MKKRLQKLKEALQSRRGRNAMTFLVFLILSAILWIVQVLNEDTQRDLRCAVRIANVPDSLMRVTPLPEAFNVSVRARGTQLIKYMWEKQPTMNIDFRTYKSGNTIQFSDAALRALFRNMFGVGSQIQSITPDSLLVAFTSQKGIKIPVKIDVHVSAAPQYMIVGKGIRETDSVMLYSVDGNVAKLRYLTTKPIELTDVKKSQVVSVAVNVPPMSRAIPDSIDITIEVEPLISKTRKVNIIPVNVPEGLRLIPVPSHVEVYYMVPMNVYKKSDTDPHFRVEADYRSIKDDTSDKVAISLTRVPRDFSNVYMSADSVDYIIEQK